MSEWANIDKLGTVGMEPDMMPADRAPQSLDIASNVRSKGTNLANAGGYTAVPFGAIPDEVVASNCSPCPAVYLGDSVQDGELVFDMSWKWDWNNFRAWLSPLEVNRAQQDYDQTLKILISECNAYRQQRIEIEVLNTAADRRVRMRRYDDQGALVETPLDYDASTEFGDGQQHWVVVEQFDGSQNRLGFNVWIDSTQIGTGIQLDQIYATRFMSHVRANSPFGLSVPVAFYLYSQTLRNCLTSGSFNGFGRCPRVTQSSPFVFDRATTDIDIDLYRDERIATPKLGTATRRTAYLEHAPIGGKVYYEIVRDIAGNLCKEDNYFVGGALRGLLLGTNTPGQVADSWGYTGPAGTLQVDGGAPVAIGYQPTLMHNTMIALDIDAGIVYLGGGNTDTPTWLGGGTPGAGASSWSIGTSAADMVALFNFLSPAEAVTILSSADSCRHAPPTGFGYLENVT